MIARGVWAMMLAVGMVEAARGASVWESLAGRWQGTGQVSGMDATLALTFAPALEGSAHRLSFSNRMRAADGREWPFAAEAVYLCHDAPPCRGHWYDTRGMILPLRATPQSDALAVEWGDAATERGRITYRLEADTLHITDEVLGKDGQWKVFGRSRLQRSGEIPDDGRR